MVKALLCPQCGAPLKAAVTVCPYCGIHFEHSGGVAEPSPLPANWGKHTNPWAGFTLAHPLDYHVEYLQGVISVRQDPPGATAVWVMQRALPAPVPARQFAAEFVRVKRAAEPAFTAWQISDLSGDETRLALRTRTQSAAGQLEGIFTITVLNGSALVAGFQCPANQAAEQADTLLQILSTFAPAEPLRRQPFRDPLENAFLYWIPQGWSASGGTERNMLGGVVRKFAARKDALGLVQAGVPGLFWTFSEQMQPMWEAMAGVPAMRFMPAADFAARWYVPQAQRGQPGLGVVAVQDHPDWLPFLTYKLAQEGTTADDFDLSVAEVITTYPEGGVGLRQRTRLVVARPRRGTRAAMQMGGGGFWTASPDFIRAPEAEFATWEPVLAGVLDSGLANPAWVQQQLSRQPQTTFQRPHLAPATNDLMVYWDPAAALIQSPMLWSNTAPAYPAMAQPFAVPPDHESYWRTGLDHLMGGAWAASPDPSWEQVIPVKG